MTWASFFMSSTKCAISACRLASSGARRIEGGCMVKALCPPWVLLEWMRWRSVGDGWRFAQSEAQQIVSATSSELEHASRQHPEVDRSADTHDQHEGERHMQRCDLQATMSLAFVVHIHHYNDAHVVIRADGAVNHSDDGQPDEICFQSYSKHVELGE